MSKDRDPQGLGELGIQLESAQKAKDRSLMLFNLGLIGAIAGGYFTSEYVGALAMLPVVLVSTLVSGYGMIREISYGRRVNYLQGEIVGIQREAQRTASLQRPSN